MSRFKLARASIQHDIRINMRGYPLNHVILEMTFCRIHLSAIAK